MDLAYACVAIGPLVHRTLGNVFGTWHWKIIEACMKKNFKTSGPGWKWNRWVMIPVTVSVVLLTALRPQSPYWLPIVGAKWSTKSVQTLYGRHELKGHGFESLCQPNIFLVKSPLKFICLIILLRNWYIKKCNIIIVSWVYVVDLGGKK